MIDGFKKFIMQGSVVDLAVGIVIGAAFGAVIGSFTESFIDPIIRRITGGGVEGGKIDIGKGQFLDWANFVNALITFAFTAAAVYFFVVVPMNSMKAKRAASGEVDDPSNEEKMVDLLEQIAQK